MGRPFLIDISPSLLPGLKFMPQGYQDRVRKRRRILLHKSSGNQHSTVFVRTAGKQFSYETVLALMCH